MFEKFKRKCTHCQSTNLTAKTELLPNYDSKVFKESFGCNNCGAESVKTTTLKKKETIPVRFLKFLTGKG